MKKFTVILLAIALLALAGCSCKHDWQEADCLTPKTCALCDKTQGEALGHDWDLATCEDPQTCSVCSETRGEALGHSWSDATCTDPATCQRCRATQGEALGHSWEEATYDAPKTCSVCVITEGDPLTRKDLGMTSEEMAAKLNSAMQLMGYQLSYWGVDEDGWPTYDVQDANGNYTNVYVSFGPHPDTGKVYDVYICAEDVTDANAVAIMGILAGVDIGIVEPEFDTKKMEEVFSGEPVMQENVAYYWMVDKGLTVEMQVSSQWAVFWIYPAE